MPGAVRTSLVQHLAGMVVDQNVGVGGVEVRTMQDTTRARALRQIAIGGALGIAVFRTRGLSMAVGLRRLRMTFFDCPGWAPRALDSAACTSRSLDCAGWA